MVSDTTLARSALLCMINNERVSRGMQRAIIEGSLNGASQAHADDMASRNYRSGIAPDPAPAGKTPKDRAHNAGYPATNNVAAVVGWNFRTPRDAVKFFMSRSADCPILIPEPFTDIGIGVASASGESRLIITLGGTAVRPATAPGCPSNKLVTPTGGTTSAQQLEAAKAFAQLTPSKIATQLGLPSAKGCRSKRAFTIRIKEPVPLTAARLNYGGRSSKAARVGGRLRAIVDLRGYKKGTVTVTINVTTAAGVKAKGVRKYKTCGAKKKNSF